MVQLKEFFYVPNIIDYGRIVFLYLALRTTGYEFAAYYAGSYLLDAVDGVAARALGQESKLGYYLDMIIDRISSTLCLVLAGNAVLAGTTFVPMQYAAAVAYFLYGCAVIIEVLAHGVVTWMGEVLGVHQKQMGFDYTLVKMYLGQKKYLAWGCISFELVGLGIVVNQPIAVLVGMPGFLFRAAANLLRLHAAVGTAMRNDGKSGSRME
eukprot:TRINITY_DN8229_c0_g1_i1.p1 TRINITY_DN8229_c0_g1~~TRINITY_DN8229_c0_g1_i1.p1  ORF type:complete len:235 (+),score=59.59 TRINITY_DN8229_c0_g1_i1:81-707(+)